MKKKASSKKRPPVKIRVSHTRKPADMSDVQWQIILRQQIAEDENFNIQKISEGAVFADYKVENIKTASTYKVALRSADNSLNFCSCPDFKTNQLGTCKHIEGVLLKIKSKPALRKQLTVTYTPPYSSVYLDYRGERKVKLRIGTEETAEALPEEADRSLRREGTRPHGLHQRHLGHRRLHHRPEPPATRRDPHPPAAHPRQRPLDLRGVRGAAPQAAARGAPRAGANRLRGAFPHP